MCSAAIIPSNSCSVSKDPDDLDVVHLSLSQAWVDPCLMPNCRRKTYLASLTLASDKADATALSGEGFC